SLSAPSEFEATRSVSFGLPARTGIAPGGGSQAPATPPAPPRPATAGRAPIQVQPPLRTQLTPPTQQPPPPQRTAPTPSSASAYPVQPSSAAARYDGYDFFPPEPAVQHGVPWGRLT